MSKRRYKGEQQQQTLWLQYFHIILIMPTFWKYTITIILY